ncbi:hypothetical protein Q7C36_002849 [Tachysurus vachellii]|uniref:Secreted protein n=1 Tax=Tachysurus vachellii TaxID=175792 RepID=A0AA88T7R8_TACVA|nr:hypothetical protein Q7C36_002849 [Tachysurus vachellii]
MNPERMTLVGFGQAVAILCVTNLGLGPGDEWVPEGPPEQWLLHNTEQLVCFFVEQSALRGGGSGGDGGDGGFEIMCLI